MISTWSWIIPHSISDGTNSTRADQLILSALKNNEGNWIPEIPNVVFTRSKLQNWIENGNLKVNSALIKPGQTLIPGAQVSLIFQETKSTLTADTTTKFEILFEDEDLLVLNKPAGLTVHPSPTQTENTLVHALIGQISRLSSMGGPLRPGIVHRLDKNTSGVMVVSKSDRAHEKLIQIFSKHQIERKYWALCYGEPKIEKNLKIENRIGRNPMDRKKMAVITKGGKPAITHIRVLQKFGKKNPHSSWIEATLETGRTHQVRVHLHSIGHSLLADPTYGVPTSKTHKWLMLPKRVQEAVLAMPGQALHARSLAFQHPVTLQQLHFEGNPPPAFQKLLEALSE